MEPDHAAALLWRGYFRLVERDAAIGHAGAHAGQEATHQQHGDVDGGALDDAAHETENADKLDVADAPDLVREICAQDAADEATPKKDAILGCYTHVNIRSPGWEAFSGGGPCLLQSG